MNSQPDISNILNRNGSVIYMPRVFDHELANHYFNELSKNIEWSHDEVKIFGKTHTTKRKVAWYGDRNFAYTYSNATKYAKPWTKELDEIRHVVELHTGTTFNSCLLNYYHNGEEGMGYHSDDESTLGRNPVIASVSFGATRKFTFKHKTSKETISLLLENGSLLLMKDETQHFWIHSLPKSKKITEPRINLTFRRFFPPL